ncbi:MAG: caspase family protein [Bacteroidota bacterium]
MQNSLIKIVFIIGLTFAIVKSYSQGPNLTGRWHGNSTFLNNHYELIYEIRQTGNQVSVLATTINKNDSLQARMEGALKGKRLELFAKEVIYKVGMGCMADNKLQFKLAGNQQTLVGRWKGNGKLNTCPALASGSVTLIKEEKQLLYEKSEILAQRSTDLKQIENDDDVGQALIRELSNRKYYALIIGVNDYKETNIQDLDNPVNDATRLAEVLTRYYSFEQSDLSLLQNPTREEIIKSLDLLAGKVTEKDNLLIFFAGHGIWNAQLNQGYWLPSDASMDSKSYWLSNSTLRDYVGGIRSKHTLLVSDACFSGGILKERAVFENSRAILELYKLPSRKAMTSGTLKTVPDKSVFIEYLLKNLVNNQAPLLSADQLFRNFKVAVINNSPNGQVPQYGPISQAGDEGGDFIFLRQDR